MREAQCRSKVVPDGPRETSALQQSALQCTETSRLSWRRSQPEKLFPRHTPLQPPPRLFGYADGRRGRTDVMRTHNLPFPANRPCQEKAHVFLTSLCSAHHAYATPIQLVPAGVRRDASIPWVPCMSNFIGGSSAQFAIRFECEFLRDHCRPALAAWLGVTSNIVDQTER